MFSNKYFKITTLYLAMTAFLTASLVSCSDDDGPVLLPNLPATGGKNVRSIQHLGDFTTSYDWNLEYSGKRLTYATGTLRDKGFNEHNSKSYSSKIKYGNHYVGVSNSDKQPVQITLNSSGLIEHMTIGEDSYNFSYTDERLTAWHKTLYSQSMGQLEKFEYYARIKYDEGNLKSIVVTGPNEVPVTTTFVSSDKENKNGLLPEAVGNAMGCFGFEHLYYAGLLGRPTRNLVKKITVDNPKDSSQCYTIEYNYSTSGNNTTLCNYNNLTTGKTASVNYTY